MGIGRERLIPSVTGFEHRRLADRCDPIPRRMWAVPTPSRDLPITLRSAVATPAPGNVVGTSRWSKRRIPSDLASGGLTTGPRHPLLRTSWCSGARCSGVRDVVGNRYPWSSLSIGPGRCASGRSLPEAVAIDRGPPETSLSHQIFSAVRLCTGAPSSVQRQGRNGPAAVRCSVDRDPFPRDG